MIPPTPTGDPLPSDPRTALLVEDPGLALGVAEGERALAERVVLVPLVEASSGTLVLDVPAQGPTLGVILLGGFVTATTTFAGHSTAQLLGPGCILQPGIEDGGLLPVICTHEALSPLRLAVLDRRFIAAVRRWPALLLALHARLGQQQRQLAVHAAIGRLPRNEDRVLAILWQIAEQWGQVTNAGVTLPVKLTHEALGRLAGASRPTTSLALTALEAEGRLRRGERSRLILDPDASMILTRASGSTPRRQRLSPTSGPDRTQLQRAALLERVAALQSGFDDRVRDVDAILAASLANAKRHAESHQRLQSLRTSRNASG